MTGQEIFGTLWGWSYFDRKYIKDSDGPVYFCFLIFLEK